MFKKKEQHYKSTILRFLKKGKSFTKKKKERKKKEKKEFQSSQYEGSKSEIVLESRKLPYNGKEA